MTYGGNQLFLKQEEAVTYRREPEWGGRCSWFTACSNLTAGPKPGSCCTCLKGQDDFARMDAGFHQAMRLDDLGQREGFE